MSTISQNFSETLYGHDSVIAIQRNPLKIVKEIRVEIVRKGLHFLIALVPSLALAFGTVFTFVLLATGVLAYTLSEFARFYGHRVPLISRLTEIASRDRDKNHFVLGPVTLGLGAMLAIMLYPNPAAAIAVYALAFGDGTASLIGKAVGRIRIPKTGGKSLEGSLACLIAVIVPSYLVMGNLWQSLAISIFATFVEALPTKDFDNIFMPTAVGAFVMLVVA